MSYIRKAELYVSFENRRACMMVARSEGAAVTADEVGDRLLSWALEQRYPALKALQKKIEDVEAEMVEAVKQ